MTITGSTAEKLAELVKSDMKARYVFRVLSEQERHLPSTDVYRIYLKLKRGGVTLSPIEVYGVFTRMQKLGVGEFIPPRDNKHAAFGWKYDQKDVIMAGLTAVGESPVRTDASSRKRESLAVKTGLSIPTSGESSSQMNLFVPYQSGVVKVSVPKGLDAKMAKVIGDFLNKVADSL